LTDSSGYDFDPEAVKAMVSWVRMVQNQLGNPDQFTPEDLLNSQKHLDESSMTELVADACRADI
jgi:hypothetical protein